MSSLQPVVNEFPAVSVVMPVRNAARYLDEAIASMVEQRLGSFELLVLDDASEDKTAEILARWATLDSRIIVHRVPKALGIASACNFLVSKASAPLIARMDGDDISHPARFERQTEVLNANPSTVLLGTLSDGIDAAGNRVFGVDYRPALSSWRTHIPAHGSWMFRRSAFVDAGGYATSATHWEDAELLLRMAAVGEVHVLLEHLFRYRFHNANTRSRHRTEWERAHMLSRGFLPTSFDPWYPLSVDATAAWSDPTRTSATRSLVRHGVRPDSSRHVAMWSYALASLLGPRTVRQLRSRGVAAHAAYARHKLRGLETARWVPKSDATRHVANEAT